MRNFLERIVGELERPRHQRPFGSGWISGALAILSAGLGLVLVVCLKFPDLFLTPELAVIRNNGIVQVIIFALLAIGYGLGLLSLVLRRERLLGVTAVTLSLLASLLGGARITVEEQGAGLFFGLDFFVFNLVLAGLLFVPLERIFPLHRDQTVLRNEWREDLFYYFVSSLFVQVLTFTTLAPSDAIKAGADLQSIQAFFGGIPWLLQVGLIMLFTDVVQYWLHRAFHVVPFLWRFHAVHHSAKSMDWIAGARMHFFEIIVLRATTATPMFVLGFDETAIQAYLLIVYVYSTFIHANLGFNFGWLERWVVLPRFHHWHHGIEREAIDVNFAIHFPIIDRLFGTHHLPENRWPEGYGVGGHPVPRGYWQQFLYPFRSENRS